jgi:prepilin-type N-terminal cleavage/methylation domain-containing protein
MKNFKGNLVLGHMKGFTLIELLVVVAIIGILASVVLASLNSARGKGGDAAVKSNLSNMRAQAEILYDKWGNYAIDATPTYFALAQCANTADTLFADPTIWGQVSAANSAGQNDLAKTRCYSSAGTWAATVQLKTGGTAADAIPDSWCVDSTGASKSYIWTAGQTVADSINATICR